MIEIKKHEWFAYHLSDIIIPLNAGERLGMFELAGTYKVSTCTLKRDFQDRLKILDFRKSDLQFYSLAIRNIGCLSLVDIKRSASFASIQYLLPQIDSRFFQQKLNQSVLVKGFANEDIRECPHFENGDKI